MVTLDQPLASARSSDVSNGLGPGAVVAFLIRHWAITLLLAFGTGVRAVTTYAYWPAFWFQSDSGLYLGNLAEIKPGSFGANNIGYPAFLWLLQHTDSLAVVAIVQHALGLGLAVAIYALLRRRDVATWLAVSGAAPILVDARQIVVEHYILSDSVFTVLLTVAAILLLWRDQPGLLACVGAAVLVVAAILTRSVGMGAAGVFLLYLVVRRVGWLRVIAFGVTVGVLMFGYLSWAQQVTGKFALSTMQGRYLYSRMAGIADCDKLELTAGQRQLCPAQPLGQRPERGDWYLWNDPNLARFGPDQDELIGSFAQAVIAQQPGDFALLVADQTGRFLVPGFSNGPAMNCLFQWWTFPGDIRDTVPNAERCKPLLASADGFSPDPVNPVVNEHPTLRKALAWYSDWVTVPRTALGLSVLLALAALCWRVRRPGHRDGMDAAALIAISLAMLVMAAATSMYEIRYALTPMVLMGMGGALAVHRLRSTLHKPDADPRNPVAEIQ